MRRRAFRPGLLLAVLALSPGVARACSVCGGGNPANRLAFFLSTIALSILPLGLFAGGLWWLRTRLGGKLADEFQDRDVTIATGSAAVPPSPGTRHELN
jgi:high-affinity Fe2+/Pb2+ permease